MHISAKNNLRTIAIVAALSAVTFGIQPAFAAENNSEPSEQSSSSNSSAEATSTSPVNLGTSKNYGVLAAAAVTNVGGSTISGDLGVDPGTAITGDSMITFNSSSGVNELDAHAAQIDAANAFDQITNIQDSTVIAAELGEVTLNAGTYDSVAAFGLTGTLTLSGSENDVWIFRTPAAFTTAAASQIVLVGGAKASNVYWQLGAAATLGASSTFAGTILAQAAITAGAGVQVDGRLISLGAAVTLDSDVITVPQG